MIRKFNSNSMKIITHPFNIKENGKELYTILHQNNGYNRAYVLPMETYDRLKHIIDNDTEGISIGLKTALNYLDIIVRIDNNHKTNVASLKSISYNYRNLRDNLIAHDIIKLTKKFQRIYNEERDDYSESTPNKYELVVSDHENFVFLFIDIDEDERKVNINIMDELDKNEVIKGTLENVEIDWKNAIVAEYHYVRNNTDTAGEYIEKFASRVNTIFRATSNRMMKKGKKVQRVYSTFTMLSSIARDYLHINGEYFHSIDLKNAQPTLFQSLCIDENLLLDKNYIKDVGDGQFYENLIKHAKKMKLDRRIENLYDKVYPSSKIFHLNDRDDVKELCYRGLFFYQNQSLKLWKVFKDLYPLTATSLIKITKDISLAEKLQNIEASIFHNVILDTDYFIVHDAIYFTRIEEYDNINSQLFTLLSEKGVEKHNLSFENSGKIERYSGSDSGQLPTVGMDTIKFRTLNKPRKPHKNHKPHNLDLINEIREMLIEGFKPKQIYNMIGDRYGVTLKTIRNNVSKIKNENKLRA